MGLTRSLVPDSDAEILTALVAADGSTGGFIKDSEVSSTALSFIGSNANLVHISNDIVGQRRTTNAQRYWLYNTYTDDSTYEALQIGWSGNVAKFQAFHSGGSVRSLQFQTSGTTIIFTPSDANAFGMQTGLLFPYVDVSADVGSTALRLRNAYMQGLVLIDGVTAPSTITGHAVLYVDSADGDLKIKFADGTVKTIVVDT